MQQITIRQAVLSDLDTLAGLFDQYRQFYKKSSDPAGARAFLADRFNHGESVLFIAHDADGAAGFTQLYPSFSSVSMARVFILNDLFVTENGRRKGVAKGLIDAARGYARTLGARSLSLCTARDNHQAQALYRATGWEVDEAFIEFSLTL